MTRLLVAFAVLSVSGCLCAKECTTNSDCTDGAICGPQKLCEALPVGGGSAGGSTGGGSVGGGSVGGGSVGGGSVGGGSAGGSVGGGMAGGVPFVCSPGCAEWAACTLLADGGPGCVAGVLTVAAPVGGDSFDAGGVVPLLATLTQQGGGAWPADASIPVVTSWGATARVLNGVPSSVAAASAAGVGVVTFGWDAGPDDVSRNVAFTSCAGALSSVQPWEKCVAMTDGGRREPVVLSVAFSIPDGGTFGPNASVGATVVLTVAAGEGPFAGMVPWSGATMLTGTGNTRTGSATTPGASGPFTLRAGWLGGPDASVTLQVDALGPQLTWKLRPDGGIGGGKRDEMVLAQLESNEALQAPPVVSFEDAGVRTIGTGACPGWSCGGARCDCYELDLAVPDLPQLSGSFGLQASARDVYGNGNSTSAFVPVTRLRWRTTIGGVASLRAAPALDSQGNLYLGTEDPSAPSGTTGRLVSLNPVNGTVRSGFPVDAGAVQSISIGQSRVGGLLGEVVYVNSNKMPGSAIDMFNTTGEPTGSALAEPVQKTYSALALFRADSNAIANIGAAAVFNTVAMDGYVGSAAPNGAARLSGVSAEYLLAVPGASAPFSPVNAIVFSLDGGSEFQFPTGNSSANRLRLQSRRFELSSNSWTTTVSGTPYATLVGMIGTGLCAAGSTTYLSIENSETPVRASRGLAPFADFAQLPGLEAAAPGVVAAASGSGGVDSKVLFGTNLDATTDWLLSVPANSSAGTFAADAGGTTSTIGVPGRVLTSPVIGGGGLPHGANGTADRVYVAHQNGVVRALVSPSSSPAIVEWTASAFDVFGGSKTVYAHPTLDCTRPFAAGRPGVLYVVATDGTVAAIIVDSSKLSTTAPWPKWQRTAGNAGNDDEALFPRNPGCN